MAKRTDPYLRQQKDAKGKLTGDFECSDCGTVFRPHPGKQGALTEEFNLHKELEHPKWKPREDFSQAAARIVREATRY